MSDITWHEGSVTRENRITVLGKSNKVFWLTGLSGSGKSTIAHKAENALIKQGRLTYVLDGDNIRHGLNTDLGFSPKDRKENIRRIAEVTKLLYEAGVTVIVAFISPYKQDREYARNLVGKDFIEVHLDCDVEECEKRDPKGLYKKARNGEIQEFTGISAPYEKPESPEILLDTKTLDEEECVELIVQYAQD